MMKYERNRINTCQVQSAQTKETNFFHDPTFFFFLIKFLIFVDLWVTFRRPGVKLDSEAVNVRMRYGGTIFKARTLEGSLVHSFVRLQQKEMNF